MIVAIDGPAGTGKSTVARTVARETGYFHLNSGGLYRAITWYVLSNRIDPDEETTILDAAQKIQLDIVRDRVVVEGKERRDELRTREVDTHVAALSSIQGVRDVVNAHLRRIADDRDVVAEGRDMTTVVFPEAEVRIYLDASLEARARRRYDDLGRKVPLDTVTQEMRERDHIDATKPVGRLIVDPSAMYIDTSLLTIDQVCEIVLRAIHSQNHTTGAFRQS
jgi:CMP/dCMP kinase